MNTGLRRRTPHTERHVQHLSGRAVLVLSEKSVATSHFIAQKSTGLCFFDGILMPTDREPAEILGHCIYFRKIVQLDGVYYNLYVRENTNGYGVNADIHELTSIAFRGPCLLRPVAVPAGT